MISEDDISLRIQGSFYKSTDTGRVFSALIHSLSICSHGALQCKSFLEPGPRTHKHMYLALSAISSQFHPLVASGDDVEQLPALAHLHAGEDIPGSGMV